MTIPYLDLQELDAGTDAAAAFVRAMGDALCETGFFCLRNHGVDPVLVERAYAAAEAVFELPVEVKQRYELPELNGQRGYTSFGRERALGHAAPDLKEFWHVGRDLPPTAANAGVAAPNVWPAEVPAFREAVVALYGALDRCAARLLEATALYLGEDRGLLTTMARNGNTLLRVIHYPPVPESADPASMRAAPHEDINLITLLCEATASGLEIQTRAGEWVSVPSRANQVIVDAGDMVQNLTNGLLRSTTHRVVNPGSSRERRLSMPFFVHPRSDASLAPLPSCVARTGEVERFPRVSAAEYLLERLRAIGMAG